ncbi:uncharacterized protein FIBRA_06593 [Fibroporia radiculosa]|uniref:LigT-like protein n=1 Tax=Fibroporia radiculosa TaxID=599839 RepID=J4IBC4_9APHY|nr:uncharacterized protein FIBRA_06593 [Fibroporia radiculosa]CCM04416.1 predicted protein [Fibroporia radiculosa]
MGEPVPRFRSQATKLKRVMQLKYPSAKSPSSFVDFDPHITLATILTTPTCAAELRAAVPCGQAALAPTFKSVDVGEKYFMSVYAVVHESPGLAALRAHLREALGADKVPPVPHLSLYYIDDADRDDRARVANELKNSGRVVGRPDGGVALNCAQEVGPGTEPDLLSGFEGAEIWIAKCDGPVPGWEVVDKISLA